MIEINYLTRGIESWLRTYDFLLKFILYMTDIWEDTRNIIDASEEIVRYKAIIKKKNTMHLWYSLIVHNFLTGRASSCDSGYFLFLIKMTKGDNLDFIISFLQTNKDNGRQMKRYKEIKEEDDINIKHCHCIKTLYSSFIYTHWCSGSCEKNHKIPIRVDSEKHENRETRKIFLERK